MHVLLICEYASLSGGEQSLLCSLDELAGRDIQFTALAPPAGPLANELRERGITVESFEVDNPGDKQTIQKSLREKLNDTIHRVRPDIVHANSLAMSRLGGPVCFRLGIPSVGHLRDIIKLSQQAVADLNQHTLLLAVSQATRQWHVSQGVAAAKTRVLYNGVDLQRFQPRPATGFLHHETGISRGSRLVGTIGQIGLRKGLDVLLAAARQVLDQCRDVHFVIVGKRFSQKQEAIAYERELQRLANRERLAPHVHFLGRRNDVPRLLNEFTVLAHTARQEPLGRVLIEAAASGTPVLATDVGGTQEIFPPKTNSAVLIPVNDVGATCGGLLRLLADHDLRRQMAQQARRLSEEKFAAADAADKLVEHYRSIVDT